MRAAADGVIVFLPPGHHLSGRDGVATCLSAAAATSSETRKSPSLPV